MGMRKSIKKVLVVMAIAILPLVTIASYAHAHARETERKELVDFIEYCKTCESLRQLNPAKDFTKASLHELKSAARFYEEQTDFADCTDYERQALVDNIIGRTYNARVNYGNRR